jgi:hypothetical protein
MVLQEQPSASLPTFAREARDAFLEATLTPVLQRGLHALCVERPDSPVEWLASWLQANKTPPMSTKKQLSLRMAVRCDFSELTNLGCGCSMPVEERAITLRQLRAVWRNIERRCAAEGWTGWGDRVLTPETVTLYDVCKYVCLPVTAARECAFVELFADSPQPPRWFVSHWWGEPVKDFIACLEQHALDHCLDEHAPYWVCAYANNQWALGEAIEADPSRTSFNKALALAEGTLSVIDSHRVAFTRIWCVYELYVSFLGSKPDFKWAVYTAHAHDGRPHTMYRKREHARLAIGLTEGDAPDDGLAKGPPGFIKRFRERHFPFELADAALSLVAESAQASVELDRVRILNRIVSGSATTAALDALPPAQHPRYDQLSAYVRARFAAGSLRAAIERGDEPRTRFMRALRAGYMKRLSLGFADCRQFTAEVAQELVAHLPRGLEVLEIAHAHHFGADKALVAALAAWLLTPESSAMRVVELAALADGPRKEEARDGLRKANEDRLRLEMNDVEMRV